MIEVENTVVIGKPVGEVFDLVGDPIRDPEWHFDVVEAAPIVNSSNGDSSSATPGDDNPASGTPAVGSSGSGAPSSGVDAKSSESDAPDGLGASLNGHSSIGEIHLAPGTRFKWVFDYMGEGRQDAEVEVKAYEPDRRLDVLAVAGPLVQAIGLKLEPLGESSTLLTRTLSLTHDEIPPHMEEVMKPRIQNRSAQYLARLRQVLEDGPFENGFTGGSCACCEG